MQSIEIIAVFSIIAFVAAEEMAHGKVVVCSVPTNKMIVVSDLAFDLNINHIDWNLCTHVIVIDNYFLEVDDIPEDERAADFKAFMQLRQRYPHLKISLPVLPDPYFNEYFKVADNSVDRKKIIENLVEFLTKSGFDGLDLSYVDFKQEFKSHNKITFEILLKDLREIFEKPKLLLTTSLSTFGGGVFGDMQFTVESVYFDFIHVSHILLDDEISVDGFTINIATKEMSLLNMQNRVDDLIKSGILPAKIVVGIQFGGVSFVAKSNESEKDAILDGLPGYGTICKAVQEHQRTTTWEMTYDNTTKLTTLKGTNQTTDEQYFFLFGSNQMIVDQMKFVMQRNLSGAMAYLVHLDDIGGKCAIDEDTLNDFKLEDVVNNSPDSGKKYATFPLLRIMNKSIALENLENSGNLLYTSIEVIWISFGLLGIGRFSMMLG